MRSLTSNDRISTLQLCVLTVMCMRVGIPNTNITYLSPYRTGFIVNNALAMLITLISLIPIMMLAARYPKRTLYEYSGELLGKKGGLILNALVTLAAIGIASGEIRPSLNILQTYLLPNTPTWVTSALILTAVCYAIKGGINSIARSSEIFFIISAICLAMVLAMSIPYIDFTFFKRHFTFGSFEKTVSSSFSIFTSFFPMGILLFFTPFADTKKPFTPVALSVAATSVVFLLIAAIVESIFGTVLSTEMFSPLIELSKLIGSDNGLLPERSNIIFMVLYKMLPQFINCTVALYIASLGIVSFFPRMSISVAGTLTSLLSFTVLLFPENSAQIISADRFWDMVQVSFLPLTLVLLTISVIKKKKKGNTICT